MRLFEEIGGKVQEKSRLHKENKKSTFRAFASRANKKTEQNHLKYLYRYHVVRQRWVFRFFIYNIFIFLKLKSDKKSGNPSGQGFIIDSVKNGKSAPSTFLTRILIRILQEY